ncbi:hypothetical protein HAX54_031072, partial [Datura stramonium]|nr:hypothetical protein [Datura stramonium]
GGLITFQVVRPFHCVNINWGVREFFGAVLPVTSLTFPIMVDADDGTSLFSSITDRVGLARFSSDGWLSFFLLLCDTMVH